MDTFSVSLPIANRLTNDYLHGKADAMQFFTYAPYQMSSYTERLQWLKQHKIAHRQELADGLAEYNRAIGNDQAALSQIEKLRNDQTYVVIAGQQAGVLTGPLYTVHKAISLLQTAQKLQAELNVDVVPVFWIAGEDHDFDEINHVFVASEQSDLIKLKLEAKPKGRLSASMLQFDENVYTSFVDQFFFRQPETEHSKELRQLLKQAAEQAKSPVEWFAKIMAKLFGKHGLVFVESSQPFIRCLEQPLFAKVIEQNEQIAGLVGRACDKMLSHGYTPQLEIDPQAANLFIYEQGERLLLERNGAAFRTKDQRISYTREQLLALAADAPERFSANVVTRPLMQEFLFPTLAFIGGPGEIAYWAFYKEYFELFGLQLPVILPRTSITLLEGSIERKLAQFDLDIATALVDLSGWKENWLAKVSRDEGIASRFRETRQAIEQMYRPLVAAVQALDGGLKGLSEKNADKLLQQIDFLQERSERSIQQRHDISLRRLRQIEAALVPGGKLQERVYSVFSVLNTHGLDFLDRLVETPFPFDERHKLVRI